MGSSLHTDIKGSYIGMETRTIPPSSPPLHTPIPFTKKVQDYAICGEGSTDGILGCIGHFPPSVPEPQDKLTTTTQNRGI
jgi:hypothetical protein